MASYILSIDVGTTNCKSMVFDARGHPVSSAHREFAPIYGRLGPGWVEQDVGVVWETVCDTTRRALTSRAEDGQSIAVVSLTTLRQSILPVDAEGRPLRYIMPWCVTATRPQAEDIKCTADEEEIYRVTGLPVSPLWTLPSFVYLRDREPELFGTVHKFVEVQDYIARKLGTEDFVTDHSQASCISLLDISSLEWSSELCDFIGITPQQLPRLVAAGTIVGEVSPDAERVTGIPRGTPICLAGGDSQVSAIGCGVIRPNSANVVIGTSAVANACVDKVTLDPGRILVCHPHAYAGKYVLDHNTLTGGNAYRWCRDNMYAGEKPSLIARGLDPYDRMNEDLKEIPVGSNGILFLPHFVGAASPYWDNIATGAYLGIRLDTDRSDLVHATIEGVCLEVQKGFRLMESLGVQLDCIRVCGGACKPGSPWIQIQADVYGKPVRIVETEDTTALGAAVIGAVAAGIHDMIPGAVSRMVRLAGEAEPNMHHHETYCTLLELQDKAYRTLRAAGLYDGLEHVRTNVSTID